MKILKTILKAVAAIIVLLLVIALFVKKNYTVEKEVLINKPETEVFEYIRYVKNQDNFSKWNQMDPNAEKSYQGTDGTVGFVYAWNSEKGAGKGEQEIKNIVDNERIDFELRFQEPFESVAPAYMMTASADGHTKLTWGFRGHLPYPLNIMNLFTPKMIGSDLQESLNNLKIILEK